MALFIEQLSKFREFFYDPLQARLDGVWLTLEKWFWIPTIVHFSPKDLAMGLGGSRLHPRAQRNYHKASFALASDFVNSKVDKETLRQDTRKYYQVALGLMDESVKARELAPLAAIRDNYPKSVISMDKTYVTDREGIRFENIVEFLICS